MSEFCNYIGKVLRIRRETVAPCCFIEKRANIFDLDEVKEYYSWLENLNDKEWDPACSRCKLQEEKGLESFRSRNFSKTYPGLEYEIQLDNICNAACIMCGSYNSTTWQKYERNISGIPSFSLEEEKRAVDSRIEHIIKNIINPDKEISLIRFLGGEPFETDTHLKFLKEIKKITNSNSITLKYNTNGSKLPNDETLEIWKEFHKVKIDISIDGINDHFNYIRWPLQWHQVEENIKFYRDLDLIELNSLILTLNPFNIFYYDRYVEWSIKTFNINKFYTNSSMGIINLSCVPDMLRDIIKVKYENIEIKNKEYVIKILNKFDPTKYKEFIKYIEFHDYHRKLNWREVFPEIEKYFENV